MGKPSKCLGKTSGEGWWWILSVKQICFTLSFSVWLASSFIFLFLSTISLYWVTGKDSFSSGFLAFRFQITSESFEDSLKGQPPRAYPPALRNLNDCGYSREIWIFRWGKSPENHTLRNIILGANSRSRAHSHLCPVFICLCNPNSNSGHWYHVFNLMVLA